MTGRGSGGPADGSPAADGDSAARDGPTLAAVTEELLAVERDLELLGRTAGGVGYWTHVRFDAQQRLLELTGATDESHGAGGLTTRDRAERIVRGLAPERNPWLAPSADLLVWGHERRTREGEEWVDRYCDPVLDALAEHTDGPAPSWVYVEGPHEGEHLTPARTDGVRYLDPVLYGAGLADRLREPAGWLPEAERRRLAEATDRLRDRFGVAPDLVALAGRRLARRRVERPAFHALLRRVAPALAVVAVWYTKPTFLEVCRERGVPVAELQHGVVSPYHLGYAYPDATPARGAARGVRGQPAVFPDHLLAFGERWRELCPLPLPEDRVHAVGYPHLERGRARYADTPTRDRVTVVSQGTTGVRLSRVVCETARLLAEGDEDAADTGNEGGQDGGRENSPDDPPELVYKLHPSEYDRWRDRTPWLADAQAAGHLRVVEDPAVDLYELFATSRAQVGAYSTALFEGLAFGCETLLVDIPGVAEYMDRLVAAGAARLVPDAGALADALRAPADGEDAASGAVGATAASTRGFDPDAFFRPDATARAVRTLDRLRR